MKRLILLITIFLLLIFTTITKNSTKEIEKQIYNIKENLRILEKKYEMTLLDFNYLSSPEKLMEYQARYFENELKEIEITNLKKITFSQENITTKQLVDFNNNE